MTVRRKVLIGAGASIGAVLAALVVLPIVFRGRIAARARAEVADAVDAQVDWSGVGLTFFRDFPNLTFRLDDLTVVGNEPFAGDTLASMAHFRLVLDLGSLIGGLRGTAPIRVRALELEEPSLHLKVLPDGTANWDVVRARATGPEAGPGEGAAPAAASAGLGLELRGLAVRGARILLEDQQTGLYASVSGLRHTLSGDFSRERFGVETETHADATTVRFAGMPYLEAVALDFVADLDADMAERRFTFARNELRLNDLAVSFSGSAAQVADDIALDLTFAAPRTEFSQILSLVPGIYAQDFEALETSGSFSLDGRVVGDWGETAFPSFSLVADVADGMFKYPDLPLAARDVGLHLTVANPGGDADSTVVSLERFHVLIGDQPVDAALALRTPISDPAVDASVEGRVDLRDLGRTVKLAEVEDLAGEISADAAVRARLSDVDSARWERVAARGSVTARDVTVRSEAIPQPIALEQMSLELSPQRAELRSLRMVLGSSDVAATGSLDNVLGFALRGEDLRGTARFESGYFDLNEWKSDDELELILVPAGLDLTLNGTVDSLTYGTLAMVDARGGLRVKDQRVTLDDFSVRTLGGRVSVNGFYETTDPTEPTFSVALSLDSLDIGRASAAFVTVRTFAPVAGYSRGAFWADMDVAGALGGDMVPKFDQLAGGGALRTTPLAIEGFPALERMSGALSVPQLARPSFSAVRTSVRIAEGRMFVQPFQTRLGGYRVAVEGSNGMDQALDYKLTLSLPTSAVARIDDPTVRVLLARAGDAGEGGLPETVDVGVGLKGTVTDPSVSTDFEALATSLRSAAADAARQAAGARADSAAAAARRRAQARADSIMSDAEARADQIRAEARRLAEGVRAEANRQADEVLSRASNPIARAAARPVADRIRKEGDDKANAMVAEADQRADQLLAEARARADALVGG